MNLFPDEAPTANQLSQVMGCSRQNVKEVLTALSKKGLVDLHQDEKDKRKQRIYLTEKTGEMAQKYSEREKAFMELLYKGISDDEIRVVYKIIFRGHRGQTPVFYNFVKLFSTILRKQI